MLLAIFRYYTRGMYSKIIYTGGPSYDIIGPIVHTFGV